VKQDRAKCKGGKKMLSRIKTLLVVVALIISGTAYAADRVGINGTVLYDEKPVCTMVLANGESMFSCNPDGKYELKVPLDGNGKITLFAFGDGLAPFKQILMPQEAAGFTINMKSALPDSPTMTLTHQLTQLESDWVEISGTVTASIGETPLRAMILANGAYVFSDAGDGKYELKAPLDANGRTTLLGFVDGFAPFKEIVEGGETCELELTSWAPRGSAGGDRPLNTATFRSTCGIDIDVSSIKMFLDDDPVTPEVTSGGSEVTVSYTPVETLQQEAEHTASITLQDVNGNEGEKTWTYFVPDIY